MYDIAFHPRFATNGLVYVSHTERYLDGALVVWEYRLDPTNPYRADIQDRRPVIAVQRRAMFHNGGTIGFGPDGYLYVGVGEGRPYQYSWAPSVNLAQTLDNLDGKILRIDVNVPLDPDGEPVVSYLVPANPFGGPIAREYAYRADMDMRRGVNFPEIWSYGMRNPWRFAFDPVTGDLFLPDVGEFDMEEINWQPANGTGGENYGWDDAEGASCSGQGCAGFVAPVHAYPHDEVHCAVIGIGVSRAVSLPVLQGAFLFSDYCAGDVSALQMRSGTWRVSKLVEVNQYAPDRQVSGGGMDRYGNVYLTTCTCASTYDFTPATSAERETGAVWKLVPLPATPEPSPLATPIAAIPFPLADTRWTMPANRLVALR
jgi:hypothetical protein